MGNSGGPMYSLSLAIFYLCLIKFQIKEESFVTKIEPFLHAVPNLFCVSTSVYLWGSVNANPAGFGCWIAPYPQNCIHNPDVECIRGENAVRFRYILSGVPVFVCFVVSFIIMLVICWTVFAQHQKIDKYIHSWQQEPTIEKRCCLFRLFCIPPKSADIQTNSGLYLPNVRRNQEVLSQACMFIASLLITNVFSYAYRLVEQKSGDAVFALALLAKMFQPLQGMFNIIAYTHPYVKSVRKHSDLSWSQAFCTVIRKGGDLDGFTRRRRSSLNFAATITPHVNSKCLEGKAHNLGSSIKYFKRSENVTSTASRSNNMLQISRKPSSDVEPSANNDVDKVNKSEYDNESIRFKVSEDDHKKNQSSDGDIDSRLMDGQKDVSKQITVFEDSYQQQKDTKLLSLR
mmetsp:Transcript_24572/g.25004  ORF Transcript_24572/g.25004 Transcript_24572/m.25004 type:complete len:401 (-) Transcript_24572:219-1421(-)